MSEPLIKSFWDWIDNIDAQERKRQDNEAFQKEQESARPEETENMKNSLGNIFWQWFDPDKNPVDLLKLNFEESESEPDPEDILSPLALDDFETKEIKTSWENLKENDKSEKSSTEKPESESEKPNYEESSDVLTNNILELHKDKDYFPIIKALSSQVSINSLVSLSKMIQNNNFELKDLNISDISDKKDSEIISSYTSLYLEKWDNSNLDNLVKDLKNIPELADFKIDKSTNTFESDILNIVWKNYLNIPNKNWEISYSENMLFAIELTSQEINTKVKNINTTCQTYITSKEKIESWNLTQALEWIESLYILAYSWEWKIWSKVLDKYKRERLKKIKEEANILDTQVSEAQRNNNNDLIEKLNKKKQELVLESSEITWIKERECVWDIFTWWIMDLSWEWDEKKESN